jgi:drug/metabolite transporter (DMT)-like permease
LYFTVTPRRYCVLAAVALTAALGDACLSLGMKHVGPVSLHRGLTFTALLAALRQPWVIAGICLLLGFFAAQLTALSWADLTYVLPATSFSYVIMALLARFALHEHVSLTRWLGVILIVVGVGYVTRGPSLTHNFALEQPAP